MKAPQRQQNKAQLVCCLSHDFPSVREDPSTAAPPLTALDLHQTQWPVCCPSVLPFCLWTTALWTSHHCPLVSGSKSSPLRAQVTTDAVFSLKPYLTPLLTPLRPWCLHIYTSLHLPLSWYTQALLWTITMNEPVQHSQVCVHFFCNYPRDLRQYLEYNEYSVTYDGMSISWALKFTWNSKKLTSEK